MALKSNYEVDVKAEQVLAEFLDKFFYSQLKIESFFRNSRDKNNFRTNQLKGIDLELKFNGRNYIIDEKATLYYPNGLPTFAFELYYKKDNQWKLGWLFDDDKKTDHYLLAWPIRRENKDLAMLTMKDIYSAEVMLINRKVLHDFLGKKNITRQSVNRDAKKIIAAKQFGRFKEILNLTGIYYTYSEDYEETPFNLVITKYWLKQLASFHFEVSRQNWDALIKNSALWL